ncbi:TRAP transporter substrate-binding protein [uncultured Brevibacillus sp.]|uniref:TRAP transporter substrate-binding protein n=1 Tax=uncultured Brevibacillus sp. TaxID=169970 RepID=UPI002594FFD9|nr:TRAP transporter substrate-binding protein [uncultured Brevibacillus sp.]
MKKLVTSLLTLSLVAMLTACGGGNQGAQQAGGQSSPASNEKPIELSYAFFAPANTFPAVQMEKWKAELERRTNGKVKVNLFLGGTLLKADNMYDGIANKVADIGLSSTTYEPGRFPLLAISDMPSGYTSSKVASRVAHDLIEQYPPEAFKDFKIITSFATEASYIQTKDPVTSLGDLKGKQLRISGALTPIMQELGASPVGMSQAEVAEALQTGVVNGLVTSREGLLDLKFAESVKYVTNYPLTINTFIAVMNKDVWNSLPGDVQKVIDELNGEMTAFTGEYLDNHVKKALEWSQKEHGTQIVELSDKDIWDQKLKTMQDKYVDELETKGQPAKEYKQKLYELIDKYSKE